MKLIELLLEEVDKSYIYHGTGKGQAIRIQSDGYIKPSSNGEEKPAVSFTADINYAKYFAKIKSNQPVILRTKLSKSFKLSDRIRNNRGDEYVSFAPTKISDLEILHNNNWYPLEQWDLIDNKTKENE